jgi:hypothetical protein
MKNYDFPSVNFKEWQKLRKRTPDSKKCWQFNILPLSFWVGLWGRWLWDARKGEDAVVASWDGDPRG